MGFFTNTPSAQPPGLQPLTRDRVEAVLKSLDFEYDVDEDGDIATGFEDGVYWIFVDEEEGILSVRGQWRGILPESMHAEAMQAAHEWNRERIWPKTFADLTDLQDVFLVTGYTVDYQPGVSDDQIEQHIRCAIGTSEGFFEALKERFPEAAAEYEEE